MPTEQVTIRTREGECQTHVATPAGAGPWPAVILYMDAGGIRPAMIDMAQQLADAGYLVLLPDLFLSLRPYGPFVPKEVFAGDFRAVLGPLMATTDNLKAADDTGAFLAYLDTRSDILVAESARSASAWAAAWPSRRPAPTPTASRPQPASTAVISRPTSLPARTFSRRS